MKKLFALLALALLLTSCGGADDTTVTTDGTDTTITTDGDISVE
jgi:ABC-type glycerol-3-phosphate transport system substrate-binding protein